MKEEDPVYYKPHVHDGQVEEEGIKIGVIEQSHGISDKGAIVIKHQYARPGGAAVLTAQGASNVASVAQRLRF